MRVLVTGSNGLLGTKLLELLLTRPDVEPTAVSRAPRTNGFLGPLPFWQVDLTGAPAVESCLGEARPDVVIHTAAMTDVDGCEREPQRAWNENVHATRNVARAARTVGARLVHLSTEYVFDGQSGPYSEDDPPHPLGVYARSKAESEQVARAEAPDCAIARTTVLYGRAPNVRTNFVTGLVAQLRAGGSARVVTDQVSSPTLADNLAEMVAALADDRSASGIFNTVGATVIDRFRFALLVAEVFALDPARIKPITTSSLGQAAPRPLAAGLRMDKFRRRYPSVPVLTARQGLERLRRELDTGTPWE